MKNLWLNLVNFLKLVRWFHELVAILPFVALYLVIGYDMQKKGINCHLPGTDFLVLCIAVQLLIAAGCVLNDIMDRHIDQINKPYTHTVGRTISLKNAWTCFVLITVLIIVFSVYISLYMFYEWAFIAIGVYALSIFYDVYLKRSPLLGNITIAVLAAFIPLVILFFARDCIQQLNNEKIILLVYLYAFFPFMIIVPRELSLDISDMEGDRAVGCKTLPLVIGEKKSRQLVVLLVALIMVVSFLVMAFCSWLIWPCLLIDVLLAIYLWIFKKSRTRLELIRAGRFIWFIMIVGLLALTLATIYE